MSRNDAELGEQASLLPVKSVKPSPSTVTKIVNRLRAMTLVLLPIEVDYGSINDPTSSIITLQVIASYRAAAGDFEDALPYCLLRARAEFMWDANHNPADYGENYGRAVACEVLARRIVHQAPPEKLNLIMLTRYKHRQASGEESDMASALETAIDAHCTIFLSSAEAQAVVIAIWRGHLIQKVLEDSDIDYVPYDEAKEPSFLHLKPSRINVPQYQNIFRIVVWLFFLVIYSLAVREPLERLAPGHDNDLDIWEIILYVMALSFTAEDLNKIVKLLILANYRALSFWNFVAFVTDSLLVAAFVLRVLCIHWASIDPTKATDFRIKSFQVLSFVSPLIWIKLVTVFDGYKFIGTMQICIARMLQESGIFFAMLSVLALGFGQGLYALSVADGGEVDDLPVIINTLLQSLLQSPNYSKFNASPAGLTLYYLWNLVTAVILLNVLISLFASAYADVVGNAEAQYLAFFAGKTIDMIRAPDAFTYPAPFNLVEIFIVAPFGLFPSCSPHSVPFAKLNRAVMSVVFFIPLSMIAIFESVFKPGSKIWISRWLRGIDEGDPDVPENRDPVMDTDGLREGEEELIISRVKFSELVSVFPNVQQTTHEIILNEVKQVRAAVNALANKLENSGKT